MASSTSTRDGIDLAYHGTTVMKAVFNPWRGLILAVLLVATSCTRASASPGDGGSAGTLGAGETGGSDGGTCYPVVCGGSTYSYSVLCSWGTFGFGTWEMGTSEEACAEAQRQFLDAGGAGGGAGVGGGAEGGTANTAHAGAAGTDSGICATYVAPPPGYSPPPGAVICTSGGCVGSWGQTLEGHCTIGRECCVVVLNEVGGP